MIFDVFLVLFFRSLKILRYKSLFFVFRLFSIVVHFQMTSSATTNVSIDSQLDCALDLMRRLPPQQVEKNLSDLIDLVPDLTEDLLAAVDQPLKVVRDRTVGKDYLLCDYNRDGDSYRSPWTNTYSPPFDGKMTSALFGSTGSK